ESPGAYRVSGGRHDDKPLLYGGRMDPHCAAGMHLARGRERGPRQGEGDGPCGTAGVANPGRTVAASAGSAGMTLALETSERIAQGDRERLIVRVNQLYHELVESRFDRDHD